MKKLIALLMATLLLFSLTVPALAAKNTVSSAFLLEKTVGTVTVESGSGKVMTKKNGMHLHSGYSVDTAKRSYAYISLDDAKVIKLDASSQAQVEASGKKLELNVTEGSMFFDVSEPLTSKETLTIRTSTMVTGIRGTCGWVTVINRYTTQISLLEGELVITSIDPLTGQPRTTVIVGGQTATIVFRGTDPGTPADSIPEDETIQDLIDDGTIEDEHIIITDTGLTVETLQEENVPGFVAVEVKNDTDLQDRIEENSPLSVPEIIGDAEERLEQEEAAAEEEEKAIQDAVEHLQVEEVDPLFETPAPSGGSSSGGTASGGTTPDPDATFYGLTVQYGYLNANNAFTYIPNAMDSVSNIEEGQPYGVDIPLIVNGYVYTDTLYTDSDPLSGTMDSDKTVKLVYLSTTLDLVNPTSTDMANALATFEPYLNNLGDQRVTLNVSGTISNDNATTTMVVPSYFDVNFASASLDSNLTLDTEAESTLNFNDTFTNYGTISGEGTMTVATGITFSNNGELLIESDQSMHVDGTLINRGTLTVGNNTVGAMYVAGTLENIGRVTIVEGSTLEVTGSLTNEANTDTKFFEIYGDATFNGTVTNAGFMAVQDGGSLTLSGTMDNESSASISIFGTFTANKISTFNNLGGVTVFTATNSTTTGSLELGGTTNNSNSIIARNSDTASAGTISNSGSLTNTGYIQTETTLENTGDFINESADFSPAAAYLRTYDNGTYTDNAERGNLYVMVTDSTGLVTAWGIVPQVQGDADPDSPFYYENDVGTGIEGWQSDYTYTLYGKQAEETDENGNPIRVPVVLPAVTTDNVTLDLNGRTMDLGSTLWIAADTDTSAGDFIIIDSSGNNENKGSGVLTTSTSNSIITLSGGSLTVDGVTLSNPNPYPANSTYNDAIIRATPSEGDSIPAPSVTITGGSTISNAMGYGISAEDALITVDGNSTVEGLNASGIYFIEYGWINDFTKAGIRINSGTVTSGCGPEDTTEDGELMYAPGIHYFVQFATSDQPDVSMLYSIAIGSLKYDASNVPKYWPYPEDDPAYWWHEYDSLSADELIYASSGENEFIISSNNFTVSGNGALCITRIEE